MAATFGAIVVAALAVAGRAANLYPRWVVFAIAAVAGACAGLWIRKYGRG